MTPLLAGFGISASYDGRTTVLDKLDITVERSQTVAVLGRSGSGKSTLLRCLAGLMPIDSGRLLFEGQEYASSGGLLVIGHELRRRIVYVPQEISLLGYYTVRRNLEIVLRAGKGKRSETRLCSLLTDLQLTESPTQLLDRYPDELSGGQRQRIQLARALLNEPAVLLLDEVTSQVDPEAVDAVVATLRKIRDTRPDLAIVIVTHNRSFADAFADLERWLVAGKLIAKPPVECKDVD